MVKQQQGMKNLRTALAYALLLVGLIGTPYQASAQETDQQDQEQEQRYDEEEEEETTVGTNGGTDKPLFELIWDWIME